MTMKYTKDHEWVRVEGNGATVGITAYAAEALGDVVFVELPEIGRDVKAHGEIAAVESVKAASEVYSPVSGTVTEVNSALETVPEAVNEDPTGKGWFYRMSLADKGELDALMDDNAYGEYLKGL
jgi:glycine cleavage system H protein